MKKLLGLGIMIALSVYMLSPQKQKITDSYIRNRVVLLIGTAGACSGVQVKAPSKKVYILTAAHCKALIENHKISAQTEDGKIYHVNVVAIDPIHDLMLLSNANSDSVEVAKIVNEHEKIMTMTHGGRYPSYRTDGELLEERTFKVMGERIETPEDMEKCQVTPYQEPESDGIEMYCVHKITVMVTTAFVIPGSSGGPALDLQGRLIGIVSCSADRFSGLVPLHDIIDFLADK